MSKHFDVILNSPDDLIESQLSDINFPPKVNFINEEEELAGYFVNFDDQISVEDFGETIFTDGGKRLVNSNSDFVLFRRDGKNKTLEILVDQAGKIPTFFACANRTLFVSSKFNNVVDFLKTNRVKITIDLDGLFTGILWDWHPTEKTLLSQIRKVPPGCCVKFFFENLESFKIKSLVDLDSFLTNKPEPLKTLSDFAENWVETIRAVTENQLTKIEKLKFGCDLSSGFDCTLVAYCLKKLTSKKFFCYSRYSEFTQGETNKELLVKFAEKHNLELKTMDVGKYYRFQFDMLSKMDPTDPYQRSLSADQIFLSGLLGEAVEIQFNGEGGDEAYGSRSIDKLARYSLQAGYFSTVSYFKKYKVQELFTPKAIDYALSNERFNQREFYPLKISVSAAAVYWHWAEKYRDYGIYLMTPFIDSRVIDLARKMPESIKGGMDELKHAVLKQVPEVFDPAMFQKKVGLENVYTNFIINQKRLVFDVLENSILASLGLIDKDKIYQLLKDEKSIIYTDNLAVRFYTMILLDWYFQANGVSETQ